MVWARYSVFTYLDPLGSDKSLNNVGSPKPHKTLSLSLVSVAEGPNTQYLRPLLPKAMKGYMLANKKTIFADREKEDSQHDGSYV